MEEVLRPRSRNGQRVPSLESNISCLSSCAIFFFPSDTFRRSASPRPPSFFSLKVVLFFPHERCAALFPQESHAAGVFHPFPFSEKNGLYRSLFHRFSHQIVARSNSPRNGLQASYSRQAFPPPSRGVFPDDPERQPFFKITELYQEGSRLPFFLFSFSKPLLFSTVSRESDKKFHYLLPQYSERADNFVALT